jgi:hypothetical protein
VSAFAGHVIGGRYVLQQRVLGNGSFGVIVLASDNQGRKMWVFYFCGGDAYLEVVPMSL